MAIKSGFKNLKEIIFCFAGLAICFYHVFTTEAVDLSLPLLLFGGTLAGSPVAMRLDARRSKNGDS